MRKAMSGLFSSPSPAATPAASHSRCSPVRMIRLMSHVTVDQARRSNVDVLSR